MSKKNKGCSAKRGPKDEVSPRDLKRRSRREDQLERKNRQLCKEVAVTLDLALRDLSEPALLHDLCIANVLPVSGSASLLVVVSPYAVGVVLDETAVYAALKAVKPKLRACVAAGIHRRKTPEFSFLVSGWEVFDG